MTSRQAMKCPECGGDMNHHADKVVTGGDPLAPHRVDPVFDGVVHEAHACPKCGAVAVRPAPIPQTR